MAARIVAIVLASIAYVLGTHWLMTQPHPSPWNVVGVLTPMLLAIAIGAWRGRQRLLGAIAALAIAALCAQAAMGIVIPTSKLYFAQHAGIHLCLALGFGSTLRAGHTPLITTLASRVHRALTPDMVVYTRKLTLAWVIYFLAIALISVLLFGVAAFDTWAVFANLVTPCSMVAMFVGEHLFRYWLHPEFERASLADAIRSYRRDSAA